MSASLFARYKDTVDRGLIESDEGQHLVLRKLEKLRLALADYQPAPKPNGLSRLFGARRDESFLPGLYVWGSVGRGKTMLMDFFFEEAPLQRKRRIHFHAFMAEAHAAIYAWRQADRHKKAKGDDPIAAVADADRRGRLAAVFRRIPRHRHHGRDDSRPAVHRPVRARRRHRRDLQRRARRTLQGWPQPRAFRSLHLRSSRRAWRLSS